MIHTDQRRRLRQSISLNRRVTEPAPEFFGIAVERRASGNKRPELPPKLAVDRTKGPPTAEEMPSLCGATSSPKILKTAVIFEIAFDLLLQRLQDSRHTHQHRYSITFDRAEYF